MYVYKVRRKKVENRKRERDVLMGDVRVRPDVRIFTRPNEWRRGVTSGMKAGGGTKNKRDRHFAVTLPCLFTTTGAPSRLGQLQYQINRGSR